MASEQKEVVFGDYKMILTKKVLTVQYKGEPAFAGNATKYPVVNDNLIKLADQARISTKELWFELMKGIPATELRPLFKLSNDSIASFVTNE